jgi:hypothetical protein
VNFNFLFRVKSFSQNNAAKSRAISGSGREVSTLHRPDTNPRDSQRSFPEQERVSHATHWPAQDRRRLDAGSARLQSNKVSRLNQLITSRIFQTLDELTDKVIPKKIKFDRDLQIDEPLSE